MLLAALGFISYDLINRRKKIKRVKRINLKHRLKKLSKSTVIQFLNDKPDSKRYKQTEELIKQSGFKISVEMYQLLTYFVPLALVILILLIKYTNVLNAMLNMDRLKEIAEKTSNPNLATINWEVNWLFLLVSVLIGHKAPDLFLKLAKGIRNARGKKEVIMLQTYAIMMLKAGKSTKSILISLLERASVYKQPLEIAVNSFSANPELALKELKNSTGSEDFEKICVALEQTLNADRNISVSYLENHRLLGKELNKINKRQKNAKKSMIGILLMIVPLLVFLMVGAYPWLLYSFKLLDAVPI